ncbi:hypothetical protein LA76x_0769 [Lysobacter antibioticus]|uniref:Uncharacterized protein n=1 Tax=Lysobacter antibioticus TaxID=84531 RepID=A0A0S2F5W2_LYSAN|nr:hypothetical protein LA76x_0769 [Lysobacter antibioticus]
MHASGNAVTRGAGSALHRSVVPYRVESAAWRRLKQWSDAFGGIVFGRSSCDLSDHKRRDMCASLPVCVVGQA